MVLEGLLSVLGASRSAYSSRWRCFVRPSRRNIARPKTISSPWHTPATVHRAWHLRLHGRRSPHRSGPGRAAGL